MESFDDSTRFAFASLCALTFQQKSEGTASAEFVNSFMLQLLEEIHMQQSLGVIQAMLAEEGHDPEPYAELLFKDSLIDEAYKTLPLRNLLLMCLRKGKILLKATQQQLNDIFQTKDLIYLGEYDARIRVLALDLLKYLKISLELFELMEDSVLDELTVIQEPSPQFDDSIAQRKKSARFKRYALIGAASVSGGVLLGLTGGLVAPLIGAGLGSLIGGASAAAAISSTAGTAIVGSLFGVAGAGLTGRRMKRRVGQVEEFAFQRLQAGESSKLHTVIAITGWLSSPKTDSERKKSSESGDGFMTPWVCLAHAQEQYALRYESRYLIELGSALDQVFNFALSMVTQQALRFTVLSGLLAAMAWPSSLLNVTRILDNPWGVCCRRTVQVGVQLADDLLAREHGKRPVTLVGFSLGARVIYYCLREMHRRGNCYGIVQDAVLIGAPLTGKLTDWSFMPEVVAGRIVNAYCRNDWLLRYLYRTASQAFEIAGLQPIALNRSKIQNLDVTDVVEGHMDYVAKLPIILALAGLKTFPEPEVACPVEETGEAIVEIQSPADSGIEVE